MALSWSDNVRSCQFLNFKGFVRLEVTVKYEKCPGLWKQNPAVVLNRMDMAPKSHSQSAECPHSKRARRALTSRGWWLLLAAANTVGIHGDPKKVIRNKRECTEVYYITVCSTMYIYIIQYYTWNSLSHVIYNHMYIYIYDVHQHLGDFPYRNHLMTQAGQVTKRSDIISN